MKIKDAINKIEAFAPLSVSDEYVDRFDSYDNSGFLIGDKEAELTGVYVTLDVTVEDLKEAKKCGCNFIFSHHPVIYSKLPNVLIGEYKGEILCYAIKNDIAVYSSHLCLDMTCGGIDDEVAKLCGIKVDKVYESLSYGSYGKVGNVEETTLEDYKNKLSKTFKNVLLYCEENKKVNRALSMCGSGFNEKEQIDFCEENNVDVVISCDVPHHIILECTCRNIGVITLMHGDSEYKGMKNAVEKIDFKTKVIYSTFDFYNTLTEER